jgi:hypothetical protein
MNRLKQVRLLGFAAILVVTWSSRGEALGHADSLFCSHQCYQGAGTICPTQEDMEAMCNEGGCSLAGCVPNWGNCQGGYMVQCNEPM